VEFDVGEVLDRAAQEAQRIFPEARIACAAPPGVVARGLPPGLRLVVHNAVANSVRHGAARRVDIAARPRDGRIEITVDDDGRGVPAGEREHVFERFARGVGAAHRGSGLGLALVAQQAALHGGSARLTESPLGGARLAIDLPMV
jgi:two-component system sensor histidine kinase PrrB